MENLAIVMDGGEYKASGDVEIATLLEWMAKKVPVPIDWKIEGPDEEYMKPSHIK